MHRSILVLVVAVVAFPRLAPAGVLMIDFDLGGSVIPASFSSGQPNPMPIPVRSGGITLSLTGVDPSGTPISSVHGATLSNFTLGVDVKLSEGNAAPVGVDFMQSGVATLSRSGAMFVLDRRALMGNARLQIQQPGAMPSVLVQNFVFTNGGVSTFVLAGLGAGAMLNTTSDALFLRFAAENVPFGLDGREVARRFVPEPSGAGLLVLVLAAPVLLAAALHARSSVRSSADVDVVG